MKKTQAMRDITIKGKWSNTGRIPKQWETIYVTMNGFKESKVIGFFETEGYLGVVAIPEVYPDWYMEKCKAKNENPEPIYVFGNEIRPL